MQLAEQWQSLLKGLDPSWGDARVALIIDDEPRAKRAAALLGPAGPGLAGRTVRFTVVHRGPGIGPEAAERMLRRIDGEQITGALELVSSDEAVPAPAIARRSLAAEWDAAVAVLPSDWTDLLCELELTSTDHIDHGALLLAPVNPLQGTGGPGFRFRCARSFGYGASAQMVRRCLARLDESSIPGELRIVRALSDTHPVGTQGPVWYVGGRQV
jgi:hypothetical protein